MSERYLPLLAAALIAVAVTVLSTGGWSSPVTPGPDAADVGDDGTADGTPSAQSISATSDGSTLGVHPLLPASLRPGGTRLLILQLSGAALNQLDNDLLEITFTLEDPSVGAWVRPDEKLVRSDSLRRTRFEIGLHPDVSCDADLGELHVAVRDVTEGGVEGEATVSMPPVNCDDGPPSSPESVHVTDPVCGDDWREELEELKEGGELDPERCAEEYWGEEGPGQLRETRQPRRQVTAEAPEEPEEAPEEPEEAPEEPEEAPEEPEEAPEEPEETPEAPEEAPEEPAETPEAPDEAPEESAREPEPPAEESGGSEEAAPEESPPSEAPEENGGEVEEG